MKQETYDAVFSEFAITHAHIVNGNEVAFVIQKSQSVSEEYTPPEELPTRLVLYLPKEQKDNEGFAFREFKYGIKTGYIYLGPTSYMVASRFGDVWESRTDNQFHQVVVHARDKAHMITGLKQIGQKVFACGSSRKIYRRDDFKQWTDLVDYKKHDYVYADILEREAKKISHLDYPMGFSCFDGFGEKDIYAGGANGSFWRYDGKQWYRIDLQTNTDIADIVCADNGNVYACLKNGGIFIGRENTWKALKTKVDDSFTFAADVKSAAWFKGKLYLGTPFNLYVLDGEDMSVYKFPEDGPKQSSFAHVAASKDALLSYGDYQALVFDGVKWREIINRPLFSQS